MNGKEDFDQHVYRCPHADRAPGEECRCYGSGYVKGKDKAHSEVRRWVPGFHAAGCGCEVCKTVATVVSTIVETLPEDAVLDFTIMGRDGVKSRLAAMLAGKLLDRRDLVGCGDTCCGTGNRYCNCPCHPDTSAWRPVTSWPGPSGK